VNFVGIPSPPTSEEIGSNEGITLLINNIEAATDEDERRKLFQVAVRDPKIFLTAEHAQRLLYETNHGLTVLEAVKMLLPQMCSSKEAVRLVETNLDWEAKLRLRIVLGQGWKPVMGALSGHYDLDFTNGKDRLAAKKLSEQATLEKRFSQHESERDDTSQTGNWENYRNGWVDGAKETLTSSYFNKATTIGKVRFDYVCTTRPKRGSLPMSDTKFEKLLKQVGLGDSIFDSEPEFFAKYLGNSVIKDHWLGWQMTTRRQYELDRAYMEKERLEELAAKKAGAAGKGKKGKKGKGGGGTPKSEVPTDDALTAPTSPNQAIANSILNAQSPSGVNGAEGGGEEEEPVPPGAFALMIGEERVLFWVNDLSMKMPSERYRGYYCALMAVETAVVSKVLSCKQAWRLVKEFPCEEDGIRVEVAMMLFSRVLDVENFTKEVVDNLTELEQRELAWRIGVLNLFSTVSVDRKYWLDFTNHDERGCLQKLVELNCIEEGGTHLVHVDYRRVWNAPVVPGVGIQSEWEENVDNIPSDMGEIVLKYKTGGKKHITMYESYVNEPFRKVMQKTCFGGGKVVF
jgi:hypothetical protein